MLLLFPATDFDVHNNNDFAMINIGVIDVVAGVAGVIFIIIVVVVSILTYICVQRSKQKCMFNYSNVLL